ncbi:MAG: DNA/RNA non-specific endonuclease [Bacteroidales bacterium]|nr:DNA/RNA non-specific endonuclease [Bacteroidales bacterium]
MKKIALFLVPAAMTFMTAGCAVVELEQVQKEDPVQEEILIHKSFHAGTAETRTTLEGKKVVFSKGEAISIYDGSGNRKFTADEAGSNVSFSGDVSSTATEFYAMSPYSESTVFTKSGSTVTAKTSLASVQEATPGSFEDGMNISAAKADSYDQFSLVNVMGVAKFTLAASNLDGHHVASVSLSSSHPLAGDVVVMYGETPSAAGGSNTVKKVTIANADGSSLSDGTYYMVVLPNAGGEITLTFTDVDGYIATKTATLKSAFEAGSIKNLGTVKGLTWVGPSYKKVSTAPTDWAGDYVLVCESSDQILTGVDTGKNIGTNGDVAISDNTISWEDYRVYNIAIAKSGNGYTLDLNNSGYLGYTGSKNSLMCTTAESVTDSYRWTLSMDSEGNVIIKNLASPQRILQYNAQSPRFCAYTSSQKAVQLYKRVGGESAPITGPAQVVLTTKDATKVTNASAILNATFSELSPLNAQEVGFKWGTNPSSLTNMAYDNSFVPQESGTISAVLTSLSAETTYYYQVTMQVWDRASNSYKEFTGEVKSFTTAKAYVPEAPQGWLELPALTGNEDFVEALYSGKERNYSYNYSYSWYASMWVAYPLTSDHTSGSASHSSWYFNLDLDESYQVHVVKNSYQTSYGNGAYSRGHQVPNADRKSDDLMNKQTYYVTNQTPQLQNKFNGTVWGNLEKAVRNELGKVDTLYVATGPVYRTVGGNEDITYLKAASTDITPANLPVPNYYWKAIMKVKWENGKVTSASSIAFWFEHKEYDSSDSDYNYVTHAVSVDRIESLTGLDLFTNLPDELESTAEANSNWTTFQNFKQ